jgi:hypothetical protein
MDVRTRTGRPGGHERAWSPSAGPQWVAAYLSRVDLRSANLNGASLADVIMRRAELARAELTSARLDGADLKGTDLRQACSRFERLRVKRSGWSCGS